MCLGRLSKVGIASGAETSEVALCDSVGLPGLIYMGVAPCEYSHAASGLPDSGYIYYALPNNRKHAIATQTFMTVYLLSLSQTTASTKGNNINSRSKWKWILAPYAIGGEWRGTDCHKVAKEWGKMLVFPRDSLCSHQSGAVHERRKSPQWGQASPYYFLVFRAGGFGNLKSGALVGGDAFCERQEVVALCPGKQQQQRCSVTAEHGKLFSPNCAVTAILCSKRSSWLPPSLHKVTGVARAWNMLNSK